MISLYVCKRAKDNNEVSNVEKGKLGEKAVTYAFWNNQIPVNHNEWDNRYVWEDSYDVYLIDFRLKVEVKNLSLKSTQNLSKAWLKEEVLDRDNIDVVVFSYQIREDLEQYLCENGVQYIFYMGMQVLPHNFDNAVINLTIQFNQIFLNNNVGVWYNSSCLVNGKIVNNKETVNYVKIDTNYKVDYIPQILFIGIISSFVNDSRLNNVKYAIKKGRA